MKKYRINPLCPYCKEKHCYYTISLTDKEQAELDNYYKDNEEERNKRPIYLNMLHEIQEKPLIIKREFECETCHKNFETSLVIFKSDEVEYTGPDFLPMDTHSV